jgi:hypothetical protein
MNSQVEIHRVKSLINSSARILDSIKLGWPPSQHMNVFTNCIRQTSVLLQQNTEQQQFKGE